MSFFTSLSHTAQVWIVFYISILIIFFSCLYCARSLEKEQNERIKKILEAENCTMEELIKRMEADGYYQA